MSTSPIVEKNYCRFCEKEHYGSKRVCRSCIEKHRPRLSTGWLIFWVLVGILPAIIYYLIKKNQQEEWDQKNLYIKKIYV